MPKTIRYLDRFGTLDYDFTGANASARMTNFTKFIEARDLGELSSYTEYEIQPGETADSISSKLYGTPEYYWMLHLINPSLREGKTAWPLTDVEMDKYLEREYDPYSWVSAEGASANYEEGSESFFLGNIPLDKKYLPHLQLTYYYIYNLSGGDEAFYEWPKTDLQIKHYDHERLGLVISRPEALSINDNALDLNNTYDRDNIVEMVGITHDNTPLGMEWRNRCYELSRPELYVSGRLSLDTLEDEDWLAEGPPIIVDSDSPGCSSVTSDLTWSDRVVAKFQMDRRFSNLEYKNAIYRWYIDQIDVDGTSSNGVVVPLQLLTHFDVLYNGVVDQIPIIYIPPVLEDGGDNYGFDDDRLQFEDLSRVTFYEYERDLNDLKKRIRVPRPEIVGDIALRYNRLIRGGSGT